MRLVVVAAMLGIAIGCASDTPTQPTLELTGDAERGRAVYQITCARCHGAEGGGVSRSPALIDVTATLTDEEIVGIMHNGKGAMSRQRLQPQQAADVLAWMRRTWPSKTP